MCVCVWNEFFTITILQNDFIRDLSVFLLSIFRLLNNNEYAHFVTFVFNQYRLLSCCE